MKMKTEKRRKKISPSYVFIDEKVFHYNSFFVAAVFHQQTFFYCRKLRKKMWISSTRKKRRITQKERERKRREEGWGRMKYMWIVTEWSNTKKYYRKFISLFWFNASQQIVHDENNCCRWKKKKKVDGIGFIIKECMTRKDTKKKKKNSYQ